MANDYMVLNSCVACGQSDLSSTLDLGQQPLANDFLEPGSVLPLFPLSLMLCQNCFHSQLSIAVNPERLFSSYSYVSGTSNTLSEYFDVLSANILDRFGKEGKLLDIGSNDGSFLQKFNNTNWKAIGIDPAVNLIPESASRGVITIPTFFNENIAQLLTHDFDVVVAMNVFAHTQNPLSILNGIRRCLSDNGIAFIQTSQANMFFTNEFDTVYHEHISFFNVRSMKALLNRAGLTLNNVSIVPIHGFSYLWEISKAPTSHQVTEREVVEEAAGLYKHDTYNQFKESAFAKSIEVQNIIKEYRTNGYKVISYGAAAKGNTFINFLDIRMDFIFDDTPQKIGKLAPAGGCVVSDPSRLADISEDLLVVVPAWNFADEILTKVKASRPLNQDHYLVYYPQTNFGELSSKAIKHIASLLFDS